jgi:D-threonate/D-erythronate kinase
MLAVVADDFSGAAEMGGTALRFGLKVEVQTNFFAAPVDLVCVDAHTRSGSTFEAAAQMTQVGSLFKDNGLQKVFKKVDSVLRGHVLVELEALMKVLGKKRALLLPANPRRGRLISNGAYYIHGQPLHQTHFAHDPQYPIHTNDVYALLGASPAKQVHIIKPGQPLPLHGICVGDVMSTADLDAWVRCLDEDTLAAGAVEFFEYWLGAQGYSAGKWTVSEELPQPGSTLFVSGSTSDASRKFCAGCEAAGVPVLRLPSSLLDEKAFPFPLITHWASDVIATFSTHSVAVIAIDQLSIMPGGSWPQRLSGYLAEAAAMVMAHHPLNRLYIEGGATIRAVMEQLNWARLQVVQELAPGIVALQAQASLPLLIVKPGSYAWPTDLQPFEDGKQHA